MRHPAIKLSHEVMPTLTEWGVAIGAIFVGFFGAFLCQIPLALGTGDYYGAIMATVIQGIGFKIFSAVVDRRAFKQLALAIGGSVGTGLTSRRRSLRRPRRRRCTSRCAGWSWEIRRICKPRWRVLLTPAAPTVWRSDRPV